MEVNGFDIRKNHAHDLFKQGDYAGCLACIRETEIFPKDPSLRILEAVCLLSLERRNEAEVCFRDLKASLPDSAEICLYLGRILEEKGEDAARAEYCQAVLLDPHNVAGLRRYAEYLIAEGDDQGALIILEKLCIMDSDPWDISQYAEVCIRQRRFLEAAEFIRKKGFPPDSVACYLEALWKAGDHEEIIVYIEENGCDTDEYLHIYLRSLASIDPDKAESGFLEVLRKKPSFRIAGEYVRFLLSGQRYSEAGAVWTTYLSETSDPVLICYGARAFYHMGVYDRVLILCEKILFESENAIEYTVTEHLLTVFHDAIIGKYPHDGLLRYRDRLIQAGDPVFLIAAARSAKDHGDSSLERDLLFRAFRADLRIGGCAYADYLFNEGDEGEWHKIISYMIRTVKKTLDLELIAEKVLMHPFHPELYISLCSRLRSVYLFLSTSGRIMFASVLLTIAKNRDLIGNHTSGEHYCLEGLEVVPSSAPDIAQDLFDELMRCKKSSLSIPVSKKHLDKEENLTHKARDIDRITFLSPLETGVLSYLARHQVCSEHELRKIAGTNLVAGFMNKMIRKLTERGYKIIEKAGYGESGEVYRYAGF